MWFRTRTTNVIVDNLVQDTVAKINYRHICHVITLLQGLKKTYELVFFFFLILKITYSSFVICFYNKMDDGFL